MNLYIVIHEHRFGVSPFLVQCDHWPTQEEVINACDIDFESDREDESIEISPIDITHIP